MTNQKPDAYNHFVPGSIVVEADSTVRDTVMELPDGREAMVRTRIGHESAADREEQRQQFYLTVHPQSLTDKLEREIDQLGTQFNEITHYDREGNAVFRYTGRERQVLEMKLANRTNALRLAQRERAFAEQVQAQAKAAKHAEEARVEAAARAKAQQLIEQAEIDRRAKQIAARAGVTSK